MPTKKRTRAKTKQKPHAVPGRVGRKALLDNSMMSEIEECLKLGNSHKTAYTLAGISYTTFYDYLKRAQDAEIKRENGESLTEDEEKYIEFADRVKKAVEWGKKRHVSIINQVAQGGQEFKTTEFYDKDGNVSRVVREKTPPNFYASAWMLERRCPDEFALRGRVDINQNTNINHNVNINHDIKVELSNANAGTVLDIMAECGAIPPPDDSWTESET